MYVHNLDQERGTKCSEYTSSIPIPTEVNLVLGTGIVNADSLEEKY